MPKTDAYEAELLAAFDKGALKSVASQAELAKFEPARPPVGTKLLNHRPEARAVVHFLQVRQFVGDDVIDDRQRHQDQAPVQRNPAVMAAATPARARGRKA